MNNALLRGGRRSAASDSWRRHTRLAELMKNMSYEVIPLRSTEEAVLAHVPTTIP